MDRDEVWTEETCRRYADAMRKLVPYDARSCAQRISTHLKRATPGVVVVDLATGPGFLAIELGKLLPQPQLVLVDMAEPMLRIAAQELEAAGLQGRTVRCEASKLELPDASAGVVTCKNLLNCVPPDARPGIIDEVVRVLEPGGKAFFQDFDIDGSSLAALFIGVYARVRLGSRFAQDFRDAARRKLDPRPVTDQLERCRCSTTIERFGPSFLIQATKIAA